MLVKDSRENEDEKDQKALVYTFKLGEEILVK